MLDSSLRRENVTLNRQEYAARNLRLKSWPRVLFIELTQKCNAACWMCRSPGGNAALPEMTFDKFREIADQAFSRAEIIDLRGWGESLIYPQFSRALAYAASFGALLKIYTNLSVSRRVCEQLAEYNVTTAVSFDAAEKHLFERLRAGCRFDLVIDNLAFLASAASAKGRRELVYLSVTVQGENLFDVPNIVELANSLGISEVKLFPVICDESDPAHLSHHLPDVARVLDRALHMANTLGVRLSCGAGLDESLTIQDRAMMAPCLHPWTYCYIDPFGQLGFCDHLIGQKAFILAGASSDFHAGWNSQGFQRLRAQHACGPTAIDDDYYPCRWCYGRRYVDTEDWIEPAFGCRKVSSDTTQQLYEIKSFEKPRLPFVSGLNR
jgi:MoaA/NifB/PqqE/SkfB family radical SAM enzyme